MFLVFTVDIQRFVESLIFEVLLYKLETHGLGSCKLSEAAEPAARSLCVIGAIKYWMLLDPGLSHETPNFLTNSSGKACNAYV